ncbi:hypothetical protein [Phosphitispora fastidiosa]|uniref:hypothetical protein n=1 Tax=Phosphitispora fastidiosa TaxID=2837202 RepID=UPI001E362968|nr:hypothetical protein [Phosphitispora fastidiosa]MBU7007178.1 hypothetical protein [Phosphitispora fastidiosa]
MEKRKHSKQPGDKGPQVYDPGNPMPDMLQSKGELVVEGKHDLEPSEEFMKNNPFKTAPNNLTSKGMSDKEKG